MVGFAGLSPEVGGLFGVLAIMFLMVAVRLDEPRLSADLRVSRASADVSMFGPHIRMRMIPAALSNDSRATAD
jgi:hypothetical protein